MVKAYLCLFIGSKSFRPITAELAEERTPTKTSEENDSYCPVLVARHVLVWEYRNNNTYFQRAGRKLAYTFPSPALTQLTCTLALSPIQIAYMYISYQLSRHLVRIYYTYMYSGSACVQCEFWLWSKHSPTRLSIFAPCILFLWPTYLWQERGSDLLLIHYMCNYY